MAHQWNISIAYMSQRAQINLAHIRKMRRKFEPANDDEGHGTAKQ